MKTGQEINYTSVWNLGHHGKKTCPERDQIDCAKYC